MVYNEQTWEDDEAGGTPTAAARLRHMEAGIAEAHRLHEVGLGAAALAEINEGESTASTSWADLLTVGPEVPVELDASVAVVRALVFVSAQIQSGLSTGGEMGVEVIGPTNRAPEQERSLRFRPHATGSESYLQASALIPVFALAPGSYVFRAKYRSTEGELVIFNHRRLVVIPLPT